MIGQRALLVVDVQRGFEDPALGPRDNPHAEENVAKLIAVWRRRGDPIVVVQHDWPGGPLERGTPGFELKEAVAGEPDLRIVKDSALVVSRKCRSRRMAARARDRRDRGVRDSDELLL